MGKLSMNNPMLTVDEVAAIFSVQPYTVREWCRIGRLKATKLNNKQWRIPYDEMEKLANEQYGS